MNKEELKDVEKCVFCGATPILYHYSDSMYYVYCPNQECNKNDKYSCLGSSKANAIEQWKFINRPLNRTSSKKKVKDESDNI